MLLIKIKVNLHQQPISLIASINNQSEILATNIIISYYRSNNSTISPNNLKLVSQNLINLPASMSESAETIISVPADNGNYYYGACITTSVDSSLIANCSAAAQISVVANQDLILDSLTISTREPKAGSDLELAASVLNSSEITSSPINITFYHSVPNSSVITNVLANESIASLASGSSGKVSKKVATPSNPLGSYGACIADRLESDLLHNNCLSLTVARAAKKIAAGDDYNCVILSDDSVKCWGENNRGQLGYGDTTDRNTPSTDSINLGDGKTAKQIALGREHSCAILNDDSVKCWGKNNNGQLGYGDTSNRRREPSTDSINLGNGKTAKQIALGANHTCAILNDNSVKCWGSNSFEQLGYGDTSNRNEPSADSINLGAGKSANQIALGNFHSCVILNDDSVKCWGNNSSGQLGYGDTTNRSEPSADSINLGDGKSAKQIVLGSNYSCVILKDDSIKCWGDNNSGRLGYGDISNLSAPSTDSINLGAGKHAKQLAIGKNDHSCAILNDDSVKCWGFHDYGKLGYDDTIVRRMPATNSINLGLGNTAKQVALGNDHSCAILNDDSVKCWGRSSKGQLGYEIDKITTPGSPRLNKTQTTKQIVTSTSATCIILNDDSVKCWGRNNYGQLGYGDNINRNETTNDFLNFGNSRAAKQLAAGEDYFCAVLNNDSVKCWGRNNYGQLGYGDTANYNEPSTDNINLGVGKSAKQIVLGTYHSCAILNDDSVKCWGRNNRGQLGYGDTTDRNEASTDSINLGAGKHAKQIALGEYHTCAILNDDSVKCWGDGSEGKLGYNSSDRSEPSTDSINLGVGKTAKQIALGDNHTCVILNDNSVKCWGYNEYGQLGYGDDDGRYLEETTPIAFNGKTAKQIALGNSHTCVIFNDNSVKCWGYNKYGQLGYGDIINRNEPTNPVLLGVNKTARKLVAKGSNSCTLLNDYSIKCWGRNNRGQIIFREDTLKPNEIIIF